MKPNNHPTPETTEHSSPKSKAKSKASASKQFRKSEAVTRAFDSLTDSWHMIRTIAALVELVEFAPQSEIQPKVIGEAARIITAQLLQMRVDLRRLEKGMQP